MYVYLKNGECVDVWSAVSIEPRHGRLACLSPKGDVVAFFAARTVQGYKPSESADTRAWPRPLDSEFRSTEDIFRHV